MKPPEPESSLFDESLDRLEGTHRFSHEAMATTFDIFIASDDREYARQAAQTAFAELDRLETQLSRFVENSDIARINNLPAGKPLLVDIETIECLKIAVNMYNKTRGTFDITVGTLMKCWLNEDKTLKSPSPEQIENARRLTGTHHIKLDETNFIVQLDHAPLMIDLGAIGKGYAVDKMAGLLKEWSLHNILISGGSSSVLAIGSPHKAAGWPLTISNPGNRSDAIIRLSAKNYAISGSGLEQGSHIIDPRTALPVEGKLAAWSRAPDAATADALSTAFMVMDPEDIEQYCKDNPSICAMFIPQSKKKNVSPKPVWHGNWKELQ